MRPHGLWSPALIAVAVVDVALVPAILHLKLTDGHAGAAFWEEAVVAA